MADKGRKGDYYNGTTNTAAGITTPPDQEHIAATDSIHEAVKAVMDGLSPGEEED